MMKKLVAVCVIFAALLGLTSTTGCVDNIATLTPTQAMTAKEASSKITITNHDLYSTIYNNRAWMPLNQDALAIMLSQFKENPSGQKAILDNFVLHAPVDVNKSLDARVLNELEVA